MAHDFETVPDAAPIDRLHLTALALLDLLDGTAPATWTSDERPDSPVETNDALCER